MPVKIPWFIAIFIGFISNVVTQKTDTCLVRRHIHSNGFHRNLITEVTLLDVKLPNSQDCDALLIENFPASVYVDVHQLDFLKTGENSGYKVHSTQDAAVEVPFHKAQAQEIYHWGTLKNTGESLKAHFTLPVHLRYHKAEEEWTTATAEIEPPKVLVRCEAGMQMFHHIPGDEVYSSCDNVDLDNLCEWKEVEYDLKHLVKVNIPVGQRSHYDKVLFGTVALSSFYMLFLLAVALKQNENSSASETQHKKRL